MKYFLNISFLFCLLLGYSAFKAQPIENKLIPHKVQINHPGISLTEPTERTLLEIKNEQGETESFFMKVETVVCGDSQCRIDTVRIYWDKFGFYDRLEIPNGIELEKAEGKHFTESDYEKLNSILANRECSLKDVFKEEVVGSESTEGIDALSGATILLHTDDFVKGAVWTCYTLWHWANGDAYFHIRNIVGEQLEEKELLALLRSENTVHQFFALEQIIRQKNQSLEVRKVIQKNAPTNDYPLTKLTIQYFEESSAEIYFSSLQELLKTANQVQRRQYLQSIIDNKNLPFTTFYDSLSTQLLTWKDYPSIHLCLKLLEDRNTTSPIVFQNVLSLLDNDNFIIARSAYWFLRDKALTDLQEEKLKAFYTKYEDRL